MKKLKRNPASNNCKKIKGRKREFLSFSDNEDPNGLLVSEFDDYFGIYLKFILWMSSVRFLVNIFRKFQRAAMVYGIVLLLLKSKNLWYNGKYARFLREWKLENLRIKQLNNFR